MATQGAMGARCGGEEDQVRELAAAADVDVANLNAPGQIVLSGTDEGIDQVVAKAKEFGIRRAMKLNVAGAYHSRLMQSAKDQLAAQLAATPMTAPVFPVVCNFTAEVVADPADIRHTLECQVTGSVRWTDSIRKLIDLGHRHFLELGPGKVIAGLLGKIDKEVTVHSVEDMASLDAVTEALQEHAPQAEAPAPESPAASQAG